MDGGKCGYARLPATSSARTTAAPRVFSGVSMLEYETRVECDRALCLFAESGQAQHFRPIAVTGSPPSAAHPLSQPT